MFEISMSEIVVVSSVSLLLSVCLFVLVGIWNVLELSKQVRYLLLCGFGLRVGTATVVDQLGTFADQVDYYAYERVLEWTATLLRDGVVTFPFAAAAANKGSLFYIPYTLIYTPVYAVFGHHTLFVRIVGAFIGVLFVLTVYRIGVELGGETAGLYAGVIATVFPYWLYLSAILYRDMLIMLVLGQLVYVLLRWEQSRPVPDAVAAVGLAGLSVILRPENVLPIGVAFCIRGYDSLRTAPLAARLTGVSGIGIVSFVILTRIGIDFGALKLHRVAIQREYLTRGGGVYLDGIVFDSIGSVLSFLPVGAVYFLLVPFPWQIHNELALLALVQNLLLWYPLIVLAVLGMPTLVDERPVCSVLVVGFIVAGVLGYGLLEGNMGPALRHRSQFQFLFVVLAGIMLARRIELAPLGLGTPDRTNE